MLVGPAIFPLVAFSLVILPNWLITIHPTVVHLKDVVERLFKITNKKIKEAPTDALYYDILAEIVTKYENQLTALELSVNEYQKSHLSNQLHRCLIVLVLIKWVRLFLGLQQNQK